MLENEHDALDALDEMEQELDEENLVYLTDEDGKEVACELLDVVDYENAVYAVLLPLDDESGAVAILRLENPDTEDESYVTVDDEAELNAVFELFKTRNQDTFSFE